MYFVVELYTYNVCTLLHLNKNLKNRRRRVCFGAQKLKWELFSMCSLPVSIRASGGEDPGHEELCSPRSMCVGETAPCPSTLSHLSVLAH